MAGKCADVGTSMAGVRGREVRDEGPDGWGPRGRERTSVCTRGSAPIGQPHRAAKEREKGRDRLTGGGRLSTRAGVRARLTGLAWAELVFPFS